MMPPMPTEFRWTVVVGIIVSVVVAMTMLESLVEGWHLVIQVDCHVPVS